MAKKKCKDCTKSCNKKTPSKVAGKTKSKIKATKKMKALVSQSHPLPETLVQKGYNRVVEKLSQSSRLVSFKNRITQLYHTGIEKCKKLLFPK